MDPLFLAKALTRNRRFFESQFSVSSDTQGVGKVPGVGDLMIFVYKTLR
jgi:hypothetical protein